MKPFLRLGSKYTLDVWSIMKPLGCFLFPSSGNSHACVDDIDPGVVGKGVVVSSIQLSNREVWKTLDDSERFVGVPFDLVTFSFECSSKSLFWMKNQFSAFCFRTL